MRPLFVAQREAGGNARAAWRTPRMLLAAVLLAAVPAWAQNASYDGATSAASAEGHLCASAEAILPVHLDRADAQGVAWLALADRVTLRFERNPDGRRWTALGLALLELAPDGRSGTLEIDAGDTCRLRGARFSLMPAPDRPAIRAEDAAAFARVVAARTAIRGGDMLEARRLLGHSTSTSTLPFASVLGAVYAAEADYELGFAPSGALDPEGARERLAAALGPSHPGVLYADHVRARYLFRQGEFDAALALREHLARQFLAQHLDGEGDAIANRVGLAAALLQQGKPAEATALLARAEREAQVRLGDLHPTAVWAALNLAVAADMDGRPQAAAQTLYGLYRAAVGHYGPRHPTTAQVLYFFSDFEATGGDLNRARAAAERAYAICLERLGPASLVTLDAQERTAYLYGVLDRTDEAVALQALAVDRLQTLLGRGNPRTLRALQNLAAWLQATGRGREGLPLAREVRDAFVVRYGVEDAQARQATLTLGYVELLHGDTATGCRRLREVAQDARDAGAGETSQLAMLGVAQCAVRAGDDAQAEAQLSTIAGELEGQDLAHNELAQTVMATQAFVALRQGRHDAARTLLERLYRSAEAQREDEAPRAASGRARFAARVNGSEDAAGYRDLALLHARDGNAARAITIAESARARAALDLLATRASAAPATPDAVRIDRLQQALLEVDAELAFEEPTSPRWAALREQRLHLADDAREQRARVKDVQGDTRILTPADWRAGADRLPNGTVYLAYAVHRGVVWGYALRRGRAPELHILDEDGSLVAAVRALRTLWAHDPALPIKLWRLPDARLVEGLLQPDSRAHEVPVGALGRSVHRKLVASFARTLRGAKVVVVASEGPLAAFPIEAVGGAAALVMHTDVVYAPSLAAHLQQQSQPPVRFPRTLIAFGDVRVSGRVPLPGVNERGVWPDLPGSATEIDSIARLYQGHHVQLLRGSDASKANLRQLAASGALADVRYLHFAVHGWLSSERPQWSSLVLSGAQQQADYITAAELSTLRIRSELVVLSACETALGSEVAGEGLFGLPHALAVAGARATLLTLWPVADASTATFMTRFYGALARGVAPRHALALAKRSFLRERTRSQPFHWAPFVLVGG